MPLRRCQHRHHNAGHVGDVAEPVAQFVKLTAEGKDDDVKYPLLESEITWGATKAHIFSRKTDS